MKTVTSPAIEALENELHESEQILASTENRLTRAITEVQLLKSNLEYERERSVNIQRAISVLLDNQFTKGKKK